MSRTGIDYSKWDKMEFSDCDDDDSENDSNQNSSACKPVVTRLDQPTRVTFGGKEKDVTATTAATASSTLTTTTSKKKKKGYGVDYSKWDKMDYSDDDNDGDGGSGDEDDVDQSYQGQSAPDRSPVTTLNELNSHGAANIETKDASWPRVSEDEDVNAISHENMAFTPSSSVGDGSNEVVTTIPSTDDDATIFDVKKLRLLTMNGGAFHDPISNCDTYWSQDRYEVTLSIVFDHSLFSTRDIRIRVTGGFSYKDRYSATASGGGNSTHTSRSSAKGTITVASGDASSSDIILKGDLPNFVYLPEGEEEVEWEIEISNNHPKKGLIRITLLKAVPMQGLTIWWKQPLVHFPEIDVETDIEGRYKQRDCGGVASSSSKHDQQAGGKVKEAWDEAHRMFRESVKNREKQVVHV